MSSATLRTRAAVGLVGRYPAAWRERYEREVTSLIEDSTLRWRDVVELFRGMLTERTRELLSSAEHPRRTRVVLSLIHPLFGMLFLSAAIAAAVALRQVVDVASVAGEERLMRTFVALVVVDLALLMLARKRQPDLRDAKYKSWVAPLLLPGLFALATTYIASVAMEPATSAGVVAPLVPHLRWFIVLGLGSTAADVASCILPSRRMLTAFEAVDAATGRLTSAQTLVENCHKTMALGLPAPVADAEADVVKWTRELESAQGRVHALAYESRFHRAQSAAAAMPMATS